MSSRRLLFAAACFALTAGILRVAASTEFAPRADRLSSVPLAFGEWRGRDEGRFDKETEDVLQADAYLVHTYTRRSLPITMFVAYYASQRTGHTIHSPLNCLPGTGWDWISRARERLDVAPDHSIEINHAIAKRNTEWSIVDYWFQTRDRTIASEYRYKIALVGEALTRHRSDGALVRVTAPTGADSEASANEVRTFIQAMYSTLAAHLPE